MQLNFLPNINWLDIFPFLAALTGGIIFLVLFYMLYWKPRVELPLPNERFVGNVTMWLPKGFGLFSGPMTTARMTMEHYFSTTIRSEKDKKVRKVLANMRDFVMSFQLFAMKNSNGDKVILMFDANPEDQRFMDVDTEGGGLYVHGVQDAYTKGTEGGFEFIGVKLNEKLAEMNEEEQERYDTGLEFIKYLPDAARNLERLLIVTEERDALKRQLWQEREDTAQVRSLCDRLASALDQKPLTVLEMPKVKTTISEIVKQWFSWKQLLVALAAYLLAPNILALLHVELKEPEHTYAILGVTVIGFFLIPIGRKIFSRWLK